VSDGDAEGESAILYALDTTEQRQLEQQFAQAQKMQAVGQLAGGVAHDFNNVLQAIIGYSDLLLNNHRPTDPSFQDIMQIKQNANRAASLVRQLLAFSRRQTLRPEVLDLGETLSDLSMLLRRLLGERVDLDFKHGRDLWPVKVDVNQFEQVIVNLAVNARDAMPDGGKLSIRTRNVPAGEARRLNLPGMPPGDTGPDRGRRHGQRHSAGGDGQDLRAVLHHEGRGQGHGAWGSRPVFGIVKQSGGAIDVQSAVSQGTTFPHLPAAPRRLPEEVAEAKSEPADLPRKPAADMTGQGTILLVEDEDPVRAVNARALSARGYTVLEAASASRPCRSSRSAASLSTSWSPTW
jgi:two-component system cell cycle sensor histidine kinase/response regulator CckA